MSGQVIIAPDKFKGTLTAAEVAAHIAAGLEKARPGIQTVQVPVADGGDGTVDAAVAAGYRRVEIGVRGPTGRPVTAAFAFDGTTAIIESAQACGLTRLPAGQFAALTATSRGVGELILAAVRMKAKRVVLGLGGSATNDGGAGMARALGVRMVGEDALEIPPGGSALARLASVDLSPLHDLTGVEFIVATDVNNPLLGPSGAVTIYGPQKGASADDVDLLEAGLTRWADLVEASLGRTLRDAPGSGAAGGLGFAALAFLDARMEPGIPLMLDLVAFESHLEGARLVVTGEGSLDSQTLHGKAPMGVASAAAKHSVPVVAMAGVCSLSAGQLPLAHIERAYALTDIEPDEARCRTEAGPLLESLAAAVAGDWLSP